MLLMKEDAAAIGVMYAVSVGELSGYAGYQQWAVGRDNDDFAAAIGAGAGVDISIRGRSCKRYKNC